MPTQAVRLSICRTAQEVANAKARDQTLGFTVVTESRDENVDVALEVDPQANGLIRELYVHLDANAEPAPRRRSAASQALTLVISSKA